MLTRKDRPYERHKLNERPIFLRTVFMLAGVMQGLRHLVEDKTRITIPIRKTDSIDGRITTQSPIDLLRKHLHHVLISAGVCTAILLLVGYGLYGVFLRRIAWQLAHTIAKTFYNLPKSNKPPHAVVYILNLVPRIAAEGFLLFLLWDLGSAAFQANIAQPPLKNSLPLSTDAKDPNGTLLQGLLVKKEFTRTAAFWELALIAHAYPARRETIYKELDRAGGSTWSHIVTVCLGEVHAVSKRIQDFYTPPPSTQLTEPQLQQSQIDPLPRLAPPLKEGQVFTNPPPPTGNDYLTKYVAPSLSKAGALAKANGQSPHAQNPAAHVGKQVLEKGRTAVSSFEQQHQASRSGLVSAFWQYIHQFLVTWFGLPFRETFARRAAAVVIGDAENGGSNVSIIVDATDSLTRLAVCSLKEDRFGRVSRDVANIVRSYTTTITNIQNFIQNLNVRWTDVAFDRRPRSQVVDEEKTRTRWEEVAFQGDIETGRVVEEVGEVLLALREGLGDLLNEFGEFRGELGLSLAEMRVAKEAVGDAGRSTGKSDGGVR